MERIEFFYDPCCPFCWITSRFLLEVSVQRDVDVTWRPFSLAMKNNELAGDDDAVNEHGEMHRSSHRVLRVITKASEQHGASVIDLYSAFGRRFHLDHEKYDDAMIADVLAAAGLPAELAEAADDTSLDEGLQASIDSALEAVGDDTGVPTIVFVSDDGQRRGFYGPVLQELPSKDDALRLWDSLVGLVSVPAFYELKRTRPEGMPDTASTKGL
ncbi:DsbA family oxidoreductase [Dermacoccus nishinomiyaensis]